MGLKKQSIYQVILGILSTEGEVDALKLELQITLSKLDDLPLRNMLSYVIKKELDESVNSTSLLSSHEPNKSPYTGLVSHHCQVMGRGLEGESKDLHCEAMSEIIFGVLDVKFEGDHYDEICSPWLKDYLEKDNEDVEADISKGGLL